MSPPSPVAMPAVTVGDLMARRILALTRLGVALLVTALVSVDALAVPDWGAWLAGLVWLPLATWAWLIEEGPSTRTRVWATSVLDLLAVAGLMLALPAHADVVAVGVVPLTALVAYRSGGAAGAAMGVAALGTWGLVSLLPHVEAAEVGPLVALLTSLLLVSTLVQRAVAVQRRDATSVRSLAQRAELILERSSEAIVVTDPVGRILQANRAARTSFHPEERSLEGQDCSDLGLRSASGPLDCRGGCALAALCEGGQDVEVWRQVGRDRQPFLASASRIPGIDGRPEHLHSFRDITKLRLADEAKTMFLSTASHELKTPLTVIRGFTQILRTTVQEPQAQVALDAIETRSAELVAIVDRLLLSSRIESGRIDLTTETVDVGALVTSRVLTLGNTLGRVIEAEVEEGALAMASRDALGTVLGHLLDNAAKYSPGEHSIRVEVHGRDDEVVIEVADRGIGMSPEQVRQCFDRFWQAEASDVRRFGGTGVGLYIVQSLVRGMGGEVTIESSLGVGTTATVHLVRTSTPSEATPGEASAASDDPQPRTSVDEFIHHLGLPARRA